MALRLIGLEHGYGRRRSLAGVSLNLEPGDRYAFLGHNGAGKTTTLRIAAGFTRPRRGRCLVDGFDAFAYPREARARIGALIEAPRFHEARTGRAHLVSFGRLRGLDRLEARREAGRVLELVGLTEPADRATRGYSQGMRQRLGIAQALVGSPRYVLLDEPLNGLDPEGIAAMRRLFEHLADVENVGVLLSSHQLAEVAGFCDRVSVLQKGRTVCEEPLEQLVDAIDRGIAITTDDPHATGELLAELGVEHVRESNPNPDAWRVAVAGGDATAGIVRRLVEGGVGVHAVVPSRPSLEEVYLQITQGATVGSPPRSDLDVEPHPPAERRAPGAPLARLARFDLGRTLRSPLGWLAWLAPVPLAVWEVRARGAEVDALLAQLRAGELFDVDNATAFEGLGLGLRIAVPLLVLVATAVASQTLAGELGQGTLRNLLLAPLRRTHVVFGKLLVVLAVTTGAFAVLAGSTWLAAATWLGVVDKATLYAGVGDTLERDAYVTVDAMATEVWPMLGQTLGAVLAVAMVGALCSALPRRGVQALALALVALLALDVGRAPLEDWDLAWLSPVEYLPSPLRDVSPIRDYLNAVLGLAESRPTEGHAAWVVPWGWIAGAAVVTMLTFRARTLR